MNDTKYWALKQVCDYADEFMVEGFWTAQGETKEEILEKLVNPKTKFPVERYFGTNEYIEFASKKDFYSTIKIEEISKFEYDVLTKLLKESLAQLIKDYKNL